MFLTQNSLEIIETSAIPLLMITSLAAMEETTSSAIEHIESIQDILTAVAMD